MSLTTNIVSYYKLDEASGDAADSVGSNTATNTSVTYAVGKINNGAVFNGSAFYSIADATSFKPTGNFSISFWIKTNTTSVGQIIQSYSQNSNVAGWTINIEATNGKIRMTTGKNTGTTQGTDWQQVLSTNAFNSNNWIHCVCSYDGTNINIYKNGVLNNQVAWNINSAYAATNYIRIGARKYNAGAEDIDFTGSLDEIGLWSRALSADEVSQLANSGRGNQYPFSAAPALYGGVAYWKLDEASGNADDATGNSNTATNHGTITYSNTAPKINNHAVLVAASSQYYSTPLLLSSLTNGTINFWIKTTATAQSEIYGNEDSNGYGINRLSFGSDGKLGLSIGNGISDILSIGSTTAINNGNWHMVTTTWGASGAKIYIDGNTTPEGSDAKTYCGSSNVNLTIGANYNNGSITWYLSGNLDEFAVWSRQITTSELTQLYNGGAGNQYPFHLIVNSGAFFNFF